MERDPQKVSAVLADPTRYSIYQHVLNAVRPVSVAEVAEKFKLHPNVARLHLSKLTDIGLVLAHTAKTGKGGRPGYVYGPSGHAVSLTVPARDFQLLADLLVQSLALLGEGGREAIDQIGRTFGRRLGREAVETTRAKGEGEKTLEEFLEVCVKALHRLGVQAIITRGADGAANLVLRTCGFQEVAAVHPEQVCHMCKAMVEGISAAVLEAQPSVTQAASVPRGDRECVYEVNGLIHLE